MESIRNQKKLQHKLTVSKLIQSLALCISLMVTGCNDSSTDEPVEPKEVTPGTVTPGTVTPEPVIPDPEVPKEEETTETSLTSEIKLGFGENARSINLTLSTATEINTDLVFATPTKETDAQQLLSDNSEILSYDELARYTRLSPQPELYCDTPTNELYQEISNQLGGITKDRPIKIEKDATIPTFIHGYRHWSNYAYAEADFADGGGADGGGTVEISRPDLVARKGTMAFSMSAIYGLIYLDTSEMPASAAKASCGMPIPGKPQNFLVLDDHILALTKSQNGHHSAVLKFSLENNEPEFIDAIVFENKSIIDARLFNQTLALYIKAYEVDETTPEAVTPALINTAKSQAEKSSIARDAMPIDEYYISELPETHRELVIVNSTGDLSIEHTDILLEQGHEDELEYQDYEPEDDRLWSSFNDFLSASDEYLIVSETVRESKFSHYETRGYRRCTTSTKIEIPYNYCQTKWKTIENPDYKPLPLSGLINCGDNLLSCIVTELPTVSRYTRVPNGLECNQGIRTRYRCDNYEWVSYDVPRYDRFNYSNFIVYRFSEGNFSRLDDTLVVVDEETNTITPTDEPFRINGIIEKHDHLAFNNGIFYAINQDETNEKMQLSTFAIHGNAAASVNNLLLTNDNNSNATAFFTDEKVFISKETSNNLNYEQSLLQTVSLAEPLSPTTISDLSIPTELAQMTFLDDTLVGIGKTFVDFGQITRTFGTAMAFDVPLAGGATTEVNSIIMAADYQYYYSAISGDDQVLHIDKSLNRLMIPYRASRPINSDTSYDSVTRLSMFDLINGELTEEHTFNLPKITKRSLSLSTDSALAFNDQEIYSLTKVDDWQFETVLGGSLPSSIYFLHGIEAQVRIYENNDSKTLNLDIYDEDGSDTTQQTIATVTLPKPKSQLCFSEKIYFDNNRVLQVTAKQGVYSVIEDCPADRTDTELSFTGYAMKAEGFEAITNTEELEILYQQITWDVHCIVDFASETYFQYDVLPSEDEEMTCMTSELYQTMKDERDASLNP